MSTLQKQAARKFVEYWTFQRGSEKGEDQQFWNSLLRDVLGVADVEQHIKYQVPVQLKDTTKFLDAWIPETRVLIEHKSRGVNLDAPQSGHDGLTPYEQAVEYDNARPFDEKARWIVTCNFDEFRIYDRAKPLAPPLTLKLGNLPKEAYRLVFLVNPKEKAIDRELEISVQAGRIVGEIYDALLKQYNEGSLLSLRGDSEARSLGENSKKSPNLQNTKTPSSESKFIFDGPRAITTDHINAYLLPAPDVFIENRGGVKTPGLDPMSKGSQPTDGGNLILTPAEREEIIAKWPDASAFILRYIGADDFINNIFRYCLWLVDVAPNRYRHIAPIMERLARVAEMRRRSPTKSVQRDAEKPMLFTQIRQPKTDYLVVPEVSSERRKYIPIGLIKPDVIVSNMLYVIPNASPYLFGVLISIVHMAWMRVVAGRLKSDYRYTPAVYNNFPWPGGVNVANVKILPSSNANAKLETGNIGIGNTSTMATISKTAQAILDARARYPESSLADLYDPLTMPSDLRAAHEANDRAVLAAYGLARDTPEPEIVAHLFKLYAEKTSASK